MTYHANIPSSILFLNLGIRSKMYSLQKNNNTENDYEPQSFSLQFDLCIKKSIE